MRHKLEISYCSRNERVRIKQSIKSQKGNAYKKTEKPGRNQLDRMYLHCNLCFNGTVMTFHFISYQH